MSKKITLQECNDMMNWFEDLTIQTIVGYEMLKRLKL